MDLQAFSNDLLKLAPTRKEAFEKRWFEATTNDPQTGLPRDLYWNPHTGAWDGYEAGPYTISDSGTPPLKLPPFEVDKIFKAIEESWKSISKDHPTAVFDPRARRWRIAKAASESPASDDLKERERRAAQEIAVLDRQYRMVPPIWNTEEYERRKVEIRQKWRLE